jgi:CheY-like chemotaxis protein
MSEDQDEKLRHALKMDQLGRLAGGIAHDFNTLLSVIVTYTDVALATLDEGHPARDHIAEIAGAATRAADLTRHLLMFTRQQPIQPRIVDVNEVIGNLEKMLRRIVDDNVEMTAVLAPHLWTVLVDPSQIEQIVLNLVVNARDAMPRGGSVLIETSNVDLNETFAKGPHVRITIRDTGIGMDSATVARAFEPFFTTKPVGSGTGLGLSTVNGLVQQCGGAVRVHSEPGKGSTFDVYLPRVGGVAWAKTPVPTSARHAPSHRGETILVIEDEEPLLRAIVELLRRHGYRVLAGRNPAEALLLSELHTGSIDLLLTDVVMPLLDGRQLAERLRRARPELTVAFMSGYTNNLATLDGRLDPGAVLVEKPFASSALLQKVREALSASTKAVKS